MLFSIFATVTGGKKGMNMHKRSLKQSFFLSLVQCASQPMAMRHKEKCRADLPVGLT